MPRDDDLKWLLVGAGDIAGKRVAAALAGSGQLVAVCDVVRERAEQAASLFGAREVYQDLDTALARTSAEAVYLATPVYLHARQARQVLLSGRHVLVEKPLGVSAADALQAVEAAPSRALTAGCAYFRRCSARYAHAREMIERGEFGRIVLVRMTYFSWFNPAPGDPKYWRVVPSKSGGGVLSDMGSHMFDVLIGLLGMPAKVYARTNTLIQPYEAEDSAAILMELPHGAQVVAGFGWNSRTWVHEFEIVGTEAKLKWFPYDSGKVVRTIGREVQELELPEPDNVHRPLVEDFARAARGDVAPAVPLAEALKTNVLLDAIYESSREGKEIRL
jgi:1,5-anhydro-D-fructose reductase (1,5-anhydro-D-mannitol-forming)